MHDTTTADSLGWANTGQLRSADHVARVEAYQNRALCGVTIAGTVETRPANPNLCSGCARELRALGIDPADIGIQNDLVAEIVHPFAIKYADVAERPGQGNFRLATFGFHIDGDTALNDTDAQRLYEELDAEVEQGLTAIAERLREKYGDRGITRITVTS